MAALRGGIAWAAIAAWQGAEGAFAPVAFASNRTAARRVRLSGVDALARCVDGSHAAYYLEEGDIHNHLWIIDLQGGGWCYDEASCLQRCPNGTDNPLCTSKNYPHELVLEQGLMNPETHSELSGAHRVFVPYCTSDAHMGDGEAFGMQFRGARVLKAVLADLVARAGLGHGVSRPLVMLAGQSAGGRGAMVHLDYVREMLGGMLEQRADVLGFLDSPLWIDVPPYSGSQFVGFAATCQGVFSYANVTHLGAECEKAHPGDDRWKCIMGEYRLPHIRTPYILIASQYDAYQLGMNSIKTPTSAAETEYADILANRTFALVNSLRAGWRAREWASASNAVFSWTCHDHASSCTKRGFDDRTCGPSGTTLDSATMQFLGLRPAQGDRSPLEWIDTCSGFNCGAGCHTPRLCGETVAAEQVRQSEGEPNLIV